MLPPGQYLNELPPANKFLMSPAPLQSMYSMYPLLMPANHPYQYANPLLSSPLSPAYHFNGPFNPQSFCSNSMTPQTNLHPSISIISEPNLPSMPKTNEFIFEHPRHDDSKNLAASGSNALNVPPSACRLKEWAPIALEQRGTCKIVGRRENSGQVVYSEKIVCVSHNGRVVSDGKNNFNLLGSISWNIYKMVYPQVEKLKVPKQLSDVFTSGFPEKNWRHWIKVLYRFLSNLIEPQPSTQYATGRRKNKKNCDMDASYDMQKICNRIETYVNKNIERRSQHNPPSTISPPQRLDLSFASSYSSVKDDASETLSSISAEKVDGVASPPFFVLGREDPHSRLPQASPSNNRSAGGSLKRPPKRKRNKPTDNELPLSASDSCSRSSENSAAVNHPDSSESFRDADPRDHRKRQGGRGSVAKPSPQLHVRRSRHIGVQTRITLLDPLVSTSNKSISSSEEEDSEQEDSVVITHTEYLSHSPEHRHTPKHSKNQYPPKPGSSSVRQKFRKDTALLNPVFKKSPQWTYKRSNTSTHSAHKSRKHKPTKRVASIPSNFSRRESKSNSIVNSPSPEYGRSSLNDSTDGEGKSAGRNMHRTSKSHQALVTPSRSTHSGTPSASKHSKPHKKRHSDLQVLTQRTKALDLEDKFKLVTSTGFVDVRTLRRTRSGRLSVPNRDTWHRQDIVCRGADVSVHHREYGKFFSSFIDD